MIARYTRPGMGAIWSEENKFRQWLEVELAASEALADLGVVPVAAAQALRRHAGFAVARIHAIERDVKHDVIAFTTALAESMAAADAGEASRWLHYGLTSNDVVDTAQALQIRQASTLIREGILQLRAVLRRRALEFQHTPQIGRTHGVHAEPITFGLKLAVWYEEAGRDLARFDAAAEDLRVGKISGAVGTFAHIGPEAEAAICARLGLKPAPVATQVIQRDRHAWYLSSLAVLTALLEKIALEVRHLQRTEVREAEEYFSAAQKGSSAMPHKRNPVTAEQICGLARVVRSNSVAALENVALWHERDISHSSVERVILPDSTILADYLLDKTTTLIDRLLVYPARMRRNLEMTRGLIYSGQLLLDLAEAGMLREDAYRLVQGHAMRAWEQESDFRAAIEADPAVTERLTPAQLAGAFSLDRQLRHIDAIFRPRVRGVNAVRMRVHVRTHRRPPARLPHRTNWISSAPMARSSACACSNRPAPPNRASMAREVINLASNNYLGLCTHPKLIEAAVQAAKEYGAGSGAVRHHFRNHAHPPATGRTYRAVQERGSVRGLSIRVRRQRGYGFGHPGRGRSHRFRRAEPCQHHRWVPPVGAPKLHVFPHKDPRGRGPDFWLTSTTFRGANC